MKNHNSLHYYWTVLSKLNIKITLRIRKTHYTYKLIINYSPNGLYIYSLNHTFFQERFKIGDLSSDSSADLHASTLRRMGNILMQLNSGIRKQCDERLRCYLSLTEEYKYMRGLGGA